MNELVQQIAKNQRYINRILAALFLVVSVVFILIYFRMSSLANTIEGLAVEQKQQSADRQKEATKQLEALSKEFESTRTTSHNERVEIVRYIRCIILLPQTLRATSKGLDSCLKGTLKKDALEEQDFLAP